MVKDEENLRENELEEKVEEVSEDSDEEEKVPQQIEIDDTNIEILAHQLGTSQTSPSLQQIAIAREGAPVNLEKSVSNVWVDDEEKEELYSTKKSGENSEREYNVNKAVKEGVLYDESSHIQNDRLDISEVGRENLIESQIRKAEFVNSENRNIKNSWNRETDYITPNKADMKNLGKDVGEKPREYFTR